MCCIRGTDEMVVRELCCFGQILECIAVHIAKGLCVHARNLCGLLYFHAMFVGAGQELSVRIALE